MPTGEDGFTDIVNPLSRQRCLYRKLLFWLGFQPFWYPVLYPSIGADSEAASRGQRNSVSKFQHLVSPRAVVDGMGCRT